MDYSPPGSSVHGILQARMLEWVAISFSMGIFPTQGLNPGLPHCRRILYRLNHQGSPRILEWVAYPSSRGSSPPRNWTGVSCIAGVFFTSWATRKPEFYPKEGQNAEKQIFTSVGQISSLPTMCLPGQLERDFSLSSDMTGVLRIYVTIQTPISLPNIFHSDMKLN